MKSILIAVAATLVAGAALAAPASDIRTSTDPAKIAAIEKHAKELQTQQGHHASKAAAPEGGSKSAKHSKSHKHASAKPANKA